jgi:hypothetical protein
MRGEGPAPLRLLSPPSARPQLRISVLAASPSDAHWYSAIAGAQISLMRQFSGQGTFKRSQLAPPLTE